MPIHRSRRPLSRRAAPLVAAVVACFVALVPDRAIAAQGRIIDEGTYLISRPGSAPQTESFRVRLGDNGQLLATGQLNAGTRRVNTALTTDSAGTPLDYKVEVRENGVLSTSLSAVARAGRLSARSQLRRGDESMREYPVVAGQSLILDDELMHETYFVALGKRVGSVQVIQPRSTSGAGRMTLSALGLEPITVGGRQVTATHYSLVGGQARRDFWVDANGRVLQVEIPASSLKAIREELPR